MTKMFKFRARTLLACTLVVFSIAPRPSLAVTTAYAHVHSQGTAQAPMDRYFGRLAMSPLGVINAIALASQRADARCLDTKHLTKSLAFVEDSVRDWEMKFPKDPWLPKTWLSIKHVYRKCADARCRKNEKRLGTWLLLHYPQSNEARDVIREANVYGTSGPTAIAVELTPVSPMPANGIAPY